MSIEAWLLFCATETVLCFIPGPAVLLVVSLSLTRGAGAGLQASCGILAANSLYFVLSATSLGAVLLVSWHLFVLVKYLGAAYLVWLGIRMILSSSALPPSAHDVVRLHRPVQNALSIGFLTQGANPKALIFFSAILPQFIDPEAAVTTQVAILGVSSVLIELVVLAIYVAACHRARGWARHPRFVVPLERLGGLLLIGAGVRLAAIRRSAG